MLKKNKFQLLLILVLSFILIAMPALCGFANSENNYDSIKKPSEALIYSIKEHVNVTLVDKLKIFRWKISEIDTTVDNIEINDIQLSAIICVNLKHTLDAAQPEDMPVLRGKLNLLEDSKKNLSKNKVDVINQDIAYWKESLKKYISEPQDASIILMIKGQLNDKGTLDPGTITLYAENPLGDYVPLDKYLKAPQDSDIEKDAYNSIEPLSRASIVIPMDTGVPRYKRSTANNYIQTYTSNTTKACKTGSDTTQDNSYYNSSYNWYQCNDCANYVSQALKAGGIPTDSTWQPYTYAWINVGGLKDYMTKYYYWASATKTTCIEGDPLTWGTDHVAMCSYNQGGVFKYSAHSSDRKNIIYTGTATFWHVVY